MRAIRSFTPWILSAGLLVACGGGDPYVPGEGSPAGARTTKGVAVGIPVLTTTIDFRPLVYSAGLSYQF